MTYTLRVYSRDNEAISSAAVTFMTSAGERGRAWPSPKAWACRAHPQLPTCLSSREGRLAIPFLTLHGAARLFLRVSLQLLERQNEPKVHATREERRVRPCGDEGASDGSQATQPEDSGAALASTVLEPRGLGVSINMVFVWGSRGSATWPHTGSLPACGVRG